MIKDKTIYLGFGTILTHPMLTTLKLIHIDPAAVIGVPITQEFKDKMTVLGEVVFKDMYGLDKKLNAVTHGNSIFEHEGYTFDFSNFNEKSVYAVQKGVRTVLSRVQLSLAC